MYKLDCGTHITSLRAQDVLKILTGSKRAQLSGIVRYRTHGIHVKPPKGQSMPPKKRRLSEEIMVLIKIPAFDLQYFD